MFNCNLGPGPFGVQVFGIQIHGLSLSSLCSRPNQPQHGFLLISARYTGSDNALDGRSGNGTTACHAGCIIV